MDTLTDTLNRLQAWDAKIRKRLDYWYRMASEHPTPDGRKRAAIEHARLTNYCNDIHEAFHALKIALWPENKEGNHVPE